MRRENMKDMEDTKTNDIPKVDSTYIFNMKKSICTVEEFVLCSYLSTTSFYWHVKMFMTQLRKTAVYRHDRQYNETVNASTYWDLTIARNKISLQTFYLSSEESHAMILFYFILEKTDSERLRKFPKFTQLVISRAWFESVFGRRQSLCS